MVQEELEQEIDAANQRLCMYKRGFLAFISIVINCAVEIQTLIGDF